MAQQFKYRITVQWSDEDSVYVARVPALPGCAAHGDTEAEAAHEARIAAEGILTVMKKHNEPLPPPDSEAEYSGKINLRMPRSLHRDLDQRAAAEGVSLNQTMLDLLSRSVGVPVRVVGPHEPREPAANDSRAPARKRAAR